MSVAILAQVAISARTCSRCKPFGWGPAGRLVAATGRPGPRGILSKRTKPPAAPPAQGHPLPELLQGHPPYSGYPAGHYLLKSHGPVYYFAGTPAWRGEHGQPHTGAVPVAGGALATGAPPAAAARRTATSRTLGSAKTTAPSRPRHRSCHREDAGGRREGQGSRGSTPRSRNQPRPTRRRSRTSTPWTST